MLEEILAFSSGDFYQARSEAIGSAVKNYADLRSQGADEEALSLARSAAEETITRIMIDNGFAQEETAYISLDKEFYNEEGEFDAQKLEQFQKEMLKWYSLQQVKWSFAGTAGFFTPITKRALEKQSQDYLDLLPVRLKKEQLLKERQKHGQHKAQPKPNTYSAFLYADGTASREAQAARARIKFDRLKDESGFDWSRGYSPDNVVKQQNGVAGFNRDGVWEKFVPGKKQDTGRIPDKGELVSRIGSGKPLDNLCILQGKEINILFDSDCLLKEGGEQVYYSLTGEVYGARAVDRERTLAGIKAELKKGRIANLSGIVVNDTSPEVVEFYKHALAEYITPDTVFYDSKSQAALEARIARLREDETGSEASKDLLVRLLALNEQLLSPEELYEHLATSAGKSVLHVPLQLFKHKEDLQVFLQLPEIHQILDPSVKAYLESLDVPPEKAVAFSNAVQNLLYNYPSLFKHTRVSQEELLRLAEKMIVKNEAAPAAALKERIVTEKNLLDFIRQSAAPGKKTDIPAFTQTFRKDGDYYLFSNAAQLETWLETDLAALLAPEARDKLKQAIQESPLLTRPASAAETLAFSRALQNSFKEFSAVAASTGLTPAELVKQIEAVIAGRADARALKAKRIFFEKPLDELIKEASLGNPHKNKTLQAEQTEGQAHRLFWKPFERSLNLFKSEDREQFLKSPILHASGLDTDDVKLLERYLANIHLPVSLQEDFSRGLINAVRGYPYQLKAKGIGLEQVLAGLEKILAGPPGRSGLSAELEQSIRRAAGLLPATAAPPAEARRVRIRSLAALAELANQDLATFLASPLVAEAALSREEAGQVQDYLKKVSKQSQKLPPQVQSRLAGSLLSALSRFRPQFAAGTLTPLSALKAVTAAVNKTYNKTPAPVRSAIQKAVAPAQTEAAPLGASLNPRRSQSDPARLLQQLVSQDAAAFSASPYLTAAGLPADEAGQVHQHLRNLLATGKPTGASGKLFAKGVLNALEAYQTTFKPRGLSPVALLSYVKAAADKDMTGVPADLQAGLAEIMQKPLAPATIVSGHDAAGEGETLLSYVAGSGQEDWNIFRQDGFENFVASDAFKRTGLSEAQLAGLVERYKQASRQYGTINTRYALKPLSLSYRSFTPDTSITYVNTRSSTGGSTGSAHGSAPGTTAGPNSVYNLGYMVKRGKNLKPAIYFTEAGKNKFTTLMYGSSGEGPAVLSPETGGKSMVSFPAGISPAGANLSGSFMQDSSTDRAGLRQGMVGLEKAFQPFVFSSSALPAKRNTGNRVPGMAAGQINAQIHAQPHTQPGKLPAGEQGFERLEKNYLQDKQMLASPVNNSAGRESSTTPAGEDKNILRETADEFIATIKRILKDSL